MAVDPIRQSHATEHERPTAPATNRVQKGASKDAATTRVPPQGHPEGTQGTRPVATTENHAGYEQGKRKQSEHESKGTLVNTYA